MDLYKLNILVQSSNPTLLRSSLVGGGDQGVLDERFAHPKPTERSCNPGAQVTREMAKEEVGTSSSVGGGQSGRWRRGTTSRAGRSHRMGNGGIQRDD
jgi:hypothetical protein